MNYEFKRDAILEQIGQRAMELDHLVQEVIDEYQEFYAKYHNTAFEELRGHYIEYQAWGRLWILTTMETEYEQATEEAEELSRQTTAVEFTFAQHAVSTLSSTVQVPNKVIAKGDEDIKAWIDANEESWDDDQPVLSTDYGSVIPGRIVLDRSFSNGS